MSKNILTDQELLQLYAQGSEAAFEQLVNRHKDRVYTAIYLMVKDQYLAEDIFQDTFIKVIDTLRSGKYNDEGKFLPWVLRISYNLCIDYFRKIKRNPGIVTSDGDDLFKYMRFEDTPVDKHLDLVQSENKLKEIIDKLVKPAIKIIKASEPE